MATGFEDAQAVSEVQRPHSGSGPHFQARDSEVEALAPAGIVPTPRRVDEAAPTKPAVPQTQPEFAADAIHEPPAKKVVPAQRVFRDCPTRGRRLRLDSAAHPKPLPAAVASQQPEETSDLMSARGLSDRLETMLAAARRLWHETESDAVLVFAERPLDWEAVREKLGHCKLLVASPFAAPADGEAADEAAISAAAAAQHDIVWIRLEDSDGPKHERLSLALLEAVADEHLRPGAGVVALYRSFDDEELDSISVIRLDERLERLTAADLRKLETKVPLETLKAVVDLAVEIGREGREGHPVGTMLVVGDTRKVMRQSRPMGFDPFHGYSAKEKNLRDRRVREELKENAQLDGAFVIDRNGIVVAARRYIDSPASGITMSKGLGSRHWAAASVTKSTKAIAVVVSQSSGTVRIFHNGQVELRIEPLRRAMKWQDPGSDQPPQPEWLA